MIIFDWLTPPASTAPHDWPQPTTATRGELFGMAYERDRYGHELWSAGRYSEGRHQFERAEAYRRMADDVR